MSFIVGSIAATQLLKHFDQLPFKSYVGSLIAIYAAVNFAYHIAWRMFLYAEFFSLLRGVKGPEGHWFFGNFRELYKEYVGVPHAKWLKEYPNQPFIRYHGIFRSERLLVASQPALQYILTHCYEYPKPPSVAAALKRVLGGEGILFAEGDVHRRQRKQMNPSFSYANLKLMSPIFWQKASKMVDAWATMTEKNNEVEVLEGLSSATLDIIGSAGFGYEFNAIDSLTEGTIQNELAAAYADMFTVQRSTKILGFLAFLLPWVRSIPFKRHLELNRDAAIVRSMSGQIVADKVAKYNAGKEIGSDIFALLLKDNRRKELQQDSGDPPMTDGEISDQTLTLLAAGHETTSAGTTWGLHALSQHQEIQDRLRAELQSVISPDEDPSFEKIESLHYLNNVTKEILRFYPPVPMTSRVAQVSAEIDGIYVPAGVQLFISPFATNRSTAIWGPDGDQFNPDRWDNLPPTHNNYGMETFLHGARSCIGQRFAVVEMKYLLAAMLLNFKFSPKPGYVVEPQHNVTMRPKGGLPLILSRV